LDEILFEKEQEENKESITTQDIQDESNIEIKYKVTEKSISLKIYM
jgi:hypothetical protein